MPIWDIEFFPPSGERDSPYDYILALSDNVEKVQIRRRLNTLRELELGEWSHRWVHKITTDIWQLTAGNNRLMYFLDGRTIVVLHACRKVKGKTRRQDKERAIIHYDEYMAQKKGS